MFFFFFCSENQEVQLVSGLEGIQLYIQQTSGGVFKFDEELLSKDADKRSEMSGLSKASEPVIFPHTAFFLLFLGLYSPIAHPHTHSSIHPSIHPSRS